MSKNIDSLIDRFVDMVNAGEREHVCTEESPASSVLVGEPDEYGFFDWQIKPYSGIDWIEPLEKILGRMFPLTYRSLITRYIFPGFDAGGLFFFANTPEGNDFHELRVRLNLDTGDGSLFQALSAAGYIQFANPDTGDYDPICFDMNSGANRDHPIVRIDHEYILCDDVVKVTEKIAPSFRELIETFLGGLH